jgi:hypothetical protein
MIVSKQRIQDEYAKIRNNGQGVIRQIIELSKILGVDYKEISRAIYESEK